MRLVVTQTIRQLMEDAGHPYPDDSTVSWSDLKEAYARSDYAARQVSLRSVCRGSSIAFDADTPARHSSSATGNSDEPLPKCRAMPSTKSQELRDHLQALQNRLDQRLYDHMVRDVTAQERCAEAAKDVSFSNYKEQMRFGAHVISMMVVFFLFGYFAATHVVASDAFRVLCGAVGMFAAMVMETALFIFRDARELDRDARYAARDAPRDASSRTKDRHGREGMLKLARKVKIT